MRGLLRMALKRAAKPIINDIKGDIGEIKVKSKLNSANAEEYHKIINNLIITDDLGHTHQIDHIEIRRNGIFCIETKNYQGVISGSENDNKWLQTIYGTVYGSEKNYFYNPIKQNNSHIYHLNKVLGGKYQINPLIVFAKNNVLKVNVPYVIDIRDLEGYLVSFNSSTTYSNEEIDNIYKDILEVKEKISTLKHINNINKTFKDINNGICPRCGGRLVERTGKYGAFIGCSNYPNCKFTMKK